MTNAELASKIDEAESLLELTTVGWSKVKAYPPEKLATTNWGKARAALDLVQANLLAPGPVPPPPMEPDPAFAGVLDLGFDTGDFSQWGDDLLLGPSALAYGLKVVDDPLGRYGGKQMRCELRDGDIWPQGGGERAQVRRGTSAVTFEGDESYYRFDLRRGPGWVDSGSFYQIVFEHHHNGLMGSPPLTYQIHGGNLVARIAKSADVAQSIYWTEVPLTALDGVDDTDMVTCIAHQKWSADPTKAVNEWWAGPRSKRKTPEFRAARKSITAPNLFVGFSNYLLAGIYRDANSTNAQVLYMDEIQRGRSFDEVAV